MKNKIPLALLVIILLMSQVPKKKEVQVNTFYATHTQPGSLYLKQHIDKEVGYGWRVVSITPYLSGGAGIAGGRLQGDNFILIMER